MFKVGKQYKFRTIEDGVETTWAGTVEAYEHPLLKLQDHVIKDELLLGMIDPQEPNKGFRLGSGKETTIVGCILNVASPNFVSAVERRDG